MSNEKGDWGNSIGKRVPDGWYTRSQVAAFIGKTTTTIARWQKDGIYIPSGQMGAGKLKVWLYSDDDVVALMQLAKKHSSDDDKDTG